MPSVITQTAPSDKTLRSVLVDFHRSATSAPHKFPTLIEQRLLHNA